MPNRSLLVTGRAVVGTMEADALWSIARTIAVLPWLSPQTVKLEGPTHLVVLACGWKTIKSDKIRTFTPECDLDAGGLPFIWLTGVSAPESIRFLLSIAKSASGATRDDSANIGCRSGGDRVARRPGGRPGARRARGLQISPKNCGVKPFSGSGSSRGRRGFDIVSRIVREDPSDKIREMRCSRSQKARNRRR